MGMTTWKEDTTLRSPELVSRIDAGLGAMQRVRDAADRPISDTKQSVIEGVHSVRDALDAQRTLKRRAVLEGLEDRSIGIKYGSAWMKPVYEIGTVLKTNLKTLAKQLTVVNRELRAAARGVREWMVMWLAQRKEKKELFGKRTPA